MIEAEMFEDRNRLDAQNNNVAGRLVRLVRALLGNEVTLADPFPVEKPFSDFGITSLKMVNLMLAVEIEFDIALSQADITPENFQSVATVEALVLRGRT